MPEPLGWPAIIGMVGGVIGFLGGIASFGDRFYKGRPVGSITTQNSYGQPIVHVRIKNTTAYDVLVTYASELQGVYAAIPAEVAEGLHLERRRIEQLLTETREVTTWLEQREQAATIAGLYGQ